MMRIQKRDGRVVPYEEEKIVAAIRKANNEVEEKDRADEALIAQILRAVKDEGRELQTVEHVQDIIEQHLVEANKYVLSKNTWCTATREACSVNPTPRTNPS